MQRNQNTGLPLISGQSGTLYELEEDFLRLLGQCGFMLRAAITKKLDLCRDQIERSTCHTFAVDVGVRLHAVNYHHLPPLLQILVRRLGQLTEARHAEPGHFLALRAIAIRPSAIGGDREVRDRSDMISQYESRPEDSPVVRPTSVADALAAREGMFDDNMADLSTYMKRAMEDYFKDQDDHPE